MTPETEKALRERLQESEATVAALRSQNAHLSALLKQALVSLETQARQALSWHLSAKSSWEEITRQQDTTATQATINSASSSGDGCDSSSNSGSSGESNSSGGDHVRNSESGFSLSCNLDSPILFTLLPTSTPPPLLPSSPSLPPFSPSDFSDCSTHSIFPSLSLDTTSRDSSCSAFISSDASLSSASTSSDTDFSNSSLSQTPLSDSVSPFPNPGSPHRAPDSPPRRKISLPGPPDEPRPPPPSSLPAVTRQRAKSPETFTTYTRARSHHDLAEFGNVPRQPWTADQQLVKDMEDIFDAARAGKPDAQFQLGRCFEVGRGVPKDFISAVKWYQKSAEQGNSYGQNSLAVCLARGVGTDKDLAQAVHWYRLSAEQENGFALNNLAMCHENGLGVPKNMLEATKLYRRAASLGNAPAQANLDRLISKHMLFSDSKH